MEVQSTPPAVIKRPIGIASKLKRHGASFANHRNYNRRDFISTLADFHQNLEIEERSGSPDPVCNDNGEEIEESETKIEWQTLQCPKCHRRAEDTQVLLDHLVENHGRPEDKTWYKEFRTVGLELNKMFEKAVTKQSDNSFVKRRFLNSRDVLVCPVDSPLAAYMMMRHLHVYIREMPAGITDGVSLKVKAGDSSHVIIFSFLKLEKVRRKIKRVLHRKETEKMIKEQLRQCQIDTYQIDDVVFKEPGTEEFKALTQAFELPEDCSREDVMQKVKEMKAKHDEVNPFCSNIYTKAVKANGQVMSKEEKRLISSLTNDMVMPVSGKRKTTNKSVIETLGKKRAKTSTPP